MTKRTPLPLLLLASLIVTVSTACDRGKDDGAKAGGASAGGGSQTQPTGSVPQVGVRYVSAEQYKPVPGAYGGRLVRGHISEPKSFNPIVSSETSTSDYTMRMFEGLTRMNMFTGEVIPGIAESWTVSDDGLTWTFKLRKDVRFNDGSPFTAEDVEFTWNDLMYDNNRPKDKADPRWPCSMRDLTTFSGKQIKCEVVDPHTVRFITPFKYAIMGELVGQPMFASKKKYAPMVAAGTFGGVMSADAKPSDIVSTGPWMLASYSRGESVTLKRNPHYWRKDAAGQSLPYLDEIVFLLARNFDTQFLQFQRGELDHYHCYRGGKDVAALRPEQQNGKFTLHQLGPEAGDAFMALNMNLDAAKAGKIPEHKVKWFRDTRFRKAISHAVDRQAIVRNVYRNLAYPEYATESVGEGPFNTPVDPIPMDLKKATALLEEMGLKDRNGDGIIEDEKGNKVQFTILTNAGNTARVEMCNILATDLRRIGMEVNSLPMEFNLLIDKLDVSFDWEAIIIAFTSMWDPHWGSNFWKSDSTNHLWWPKQKQPGFPWEKRLDDLFEQAIQELDRPKRKALYAEVTRISYDETPVVFLAVRERVDAVRNKFGNLFPSPYPLWEFSALHNEDELFLLSNADKAPKAAPVAAATAPAGAGAPQIMATYIVRRLLFSVVLIFLSSVASFAILKASPGTAVAADFDPRMSKEYRDQQLRLLGLDRHPVRQYTDWLGVTPPAGHDKPRGLFQGYLGDSIMYRQPVSKVIGSRVGATLTLNLCALVFTWMVAIPLGIYAAVHQYKWPDKVLSTVSFAGMSMPGFFLALLLLWVFASHYRILPPGGLRDVVNHDSFTTWGKFTDYAHHLIVPVVVLAFGALAELQRISRGNMLETLRMQYIITARAKGLSETRVIYKHALRNAVNPLVTILGFEFAALFGGAALMELVINYPGMGVLLLEALRAKDQPLVLSLFLIGSVMLVLGNLLSEILLAFVDPRVSYA